MQMVKAWTHVCGSKRCCVCIENLNKERDMCAGIFASFVQIGEPNAFESLVIVTTGFQLVNTAYKYRKWNMTT